MQTSTEVMIHSKKEKYNLMTEYRTNTSHSETSTFFFNP